jgi:hypothetical protein
VTVSCESASAPPAELVAAWVQADLPPNAMARVAGPERVVVEDVPAELTGQLRALLRESRFAGWQVTDQP